MSQKLSSSDHEITSQNPSVSVKDSSKNSQQAPFVDCVLEIVQSFGMDPKKEAVQKEVKSCHDLFCDINPQSSIEKMLAVQMVGTHRMILKMMRLAHDQVYPDIVNTYINSVTKLSRTFTSQMEALNRHRGKGQQKMTVEHVHVNAGGQAIIGTVQTDQEKNKATGRGHEKSEEQPHAEG
jgi:hypothetical protein